MNDRKKSAWGESRISRRQILRYSFAGMAGIVGGFRPVSAFEKTNVMSCAKTEGRSMYFKLRDRIFDIAKARIKFYYFDESEASRWPDQQPGLFLCASVSTKCKIFDDYEWCPGLDHNDGIKIDIPHWTELEGKHWTFNDEYNENHKAGYLSIFEAEPIKECRFEVLKRNGRTFTIKWNGVGNVYWRDSDYDKDVPFDSEFIAEFKGIGIQQCVADQTEKGLRETLGKLIDLNDFKLVDTKIGLKEFVFK